MNFKTEALKRVKISENELKEIQQESESIKMAAIQAYVEKEHQLMELTAKNERLEGKIFFYEENQNDIQNEREEMQKRIIDLATMLDKEAESNEKRRKEIEYEVDEKVQKKMVENLKKFEENKHQMIETMQFGNFFKKILYFSSFSSLISSFLSFYSLISSYFFFFLP